MVFLYEFTPEQLASYEQQLKEGVFVMPCVPGTWQEWYLLERHQQILFQKIQKLAEAFLLAIPVEEPSIRGSEGNWNEWNTLSTNQRRLSVALDYLIAESKLFKTLPSYESKPIVGPVPEFTTERLAYYDEQLKKGVFVIPPLALGYSQEWYILERNQRILFQKIQKLAEVLSCAKPVEPSVLGFENGCKEWTTLNVNQKRLSDALDNLLAAKPKPTPQCQCQAVAVAGRRS